MKKALNILAVGAVALSLGGCATSYPVGGLITEIQLPVAVTDNNGSASKVGEANCASYIGMVATGDCSLETAKKNGNITKVKHVDWHVDNLLGIIGKYKLVVYGH